MKGKRLLFLTATMFLSASALWIKSYVIPSRITYHHKNAFMVVVDDWKGRLYVDFSDPTYMQGSVRTEYGNALGWSDTTWLSTYFTGPESWFLRFPNRGRWTGITFLTPIWFAWLNSAALLSAAWMRFVKAKRDKVENPCSNCGYSLTGNTSGVCPECGEAATSIQGKRS